MAENAATRTELTVGPWKDPIIGIVKHFVELLPTEQSEKRLAFLTATFQELFDDRKDQHKQDVVELEWKGTAQTSII